MYSVPGISAKEPICSSTSGCYSLTYRLFYLPSSRWQRLILLAFGAYSSLIVLKHIFLKYPWKLFVDSHTWIGEKSGLIMCFLFSLPQFVFLRIIHCTGNHNYKDKLFQLSDAPVFIGHNLVCISKISQDLWYLLALFYLLALCSQVCPYLYHLFFLYRRKTRIRFHRFSLI